LKDLNQRGIKGQETQEEREKQKNYNHIVPNEFLRFRYGGNFYLRLEIVFQCAVALYMQSNSGEAGGSFAEMFSKNLSWRQNDLNNMHKHRTRV